MKFLNFFVLLILISFSSSFSQILVHPVNLDFEQSVEGELPYGWSFLGHFSKMGYKAFSSSKNVYQGKFCLNLTTDFVNIKDIPNPDSSEIQSVIFQQIESNYFVGKEVYFAIKYRVINPNEQNSAMIFLQQENNDIHFFRLSSSDTLRSNEWKEASISMMIDSLSKVIKIGLIAFGTATVQFDDAVFNFSYDFTKNNPPVSFTEVVHKNLFDLAKVYGTVKYFYPSPFLKDYPWDALLYEQIEKAVKMSEKPYLSQLKKTFSDIAVNTSKSSQTVKSASNYVYTGIPLKVATPLANQKIADIFVPSKNSPGTIINFSNISQEIARKIKVSLKYKFKPYSYNAKASVGLRFDNSKGISLWEIQNDSLLKNQKDWNKIDLITEVPENTATMRIGLILEGDGEVFFDDIQAKSLTSGIEKNIEIRNGNFESPSINNYISGWNFPQHSQSAGYNFAISQDAAEGKNSLKLFSFKEDLVLFPEINSFYSDTLNDGSVFLTPLSVPVNSLTKIDASSFNLPNNFAMNFDDSFSRIATIIEIWNFMRHFSLNRINNQILENAFSNAIFFANKATSLEKLQEVIKNLAVIANDANFKIWNGFDPTLYFPNLGIFVQGKEVFSLKSDSVGIPSGSKLIKINQVSIDSLINVTLNLYRNNSLNNQFLIYREIVNNLSGIINTSKELTYQTSPGKTESKKVFLEKLDLQKMDKPDFISEVAPGVIYFNSAKITDEDFRNVFPQLQSPDIKGIIIDLRGYSLLSEHILGLFTENSIRSFNAEIPVYTAPNHSLISYSIKQSNIKIIPKLKDKKVVFIINEFSNSYSEIIAAVARINKIGRVIGTPTQGNITEMEQLSFPAYFFGSQSVMKIKLQGEDKYLSDPISPEIRIEQSIQNLILGIDDQLEKAINLIR